MKSKIIFILLLISLGFNAGIIVAYSTRTYHKPNEFMPKPHSKNNHRAKNIFQNEEIIEARKTNIQLRKAFFAELAKPEYDIAIINDLSKQLENSQLELERMVLNYFVETRTQFTPEEAKEFFGRFNRTKE